VFNAYSPSGSGAGQKAFLQDDLTCDLNKVDGNNGGACSNLPPTNGNYVDYGASDSTLSATQATAWTSGSYTYGQAVSGNLIQLPALGVGIAFPIVDAGFTANGAASLSDHDLCEIFSGGYTDYSQITDSVTLKKKKATFAAGLFDVVYRGDSSGTSFLLTQHLNAVCSAADVPAGFTFTATTTFASLFNGSSSFNGQPTAFSCANSLCVVTNGLTNGPNDGPSGSGGVFNELEGEGSQPALGYISPDYTTIDPNSTVQVNGKTSTLLVASVLNGKSPELPTTTLIAKALGHPKAGATGNANLKPPSTAAQGANPLLWVPAIAVASTGYPVVGYTTLDLAQCYADPTVATGVVTFLNQHFGFSKDVYSKDDAEYQGYNGFVTLKQGGRAAFATAILDHIVGNTGTKNAPAWNINIGNTTACSGIGR
jgi:ABC-type phosphate transport system substrate-binding protein